MRLRANIRRATGNARQLVDTVDVTPRIARLETEQQAEGGWLLLYVDAAGAELADTWHETLDDAKRQAAFEYDIDVGDWLPAP